MNHSTRPAVPRLLLLAVVMTVVMLPASVWAQTTLRWQFAAGQQLQQNLTQEMGMTMNMQGQDIQTSMTQTVDTLWKVNAVDQDGVADMTQTITRIVMKVKAPGMELNVDTSAEELPEGVGKPIAEALKSLANKTFTLKMNTMGEVLDVTVPNDMAEAVKKIPGGEQLAGLFSEEGLKNMIMQGTPSFPKEAVTKGTDWTRKLSMKVAPVGTMNIVSKYTYAGEEAGDPPLDKLDVDVQQSLETGEGGPQITVKDQKTEGTILFDNKAGRMVRSDIQQKMTLEIVVGGQTINQKIDQAIKVTFTPVK